MLSTATMVDTLDPRFQDIIDDAFRQKEDLVSRDYQMVGGTQLTERFSSIGAMGDIPLFNGKLTYDDVFQGYDVTLTALELARGISIEKLLFDTDQHNTINSKPQAIGMAANRTRHGHRVRPFNQAFVVDTLFGVNSEGVPLCSDSHTSTAPDTNTATGFDNLVVDAFSATALNSLRNQMKLVRGDRGEIIEVNPNRIYYPVGLNERVQEVIQSELKVDTANNNKNIQKGAWEGVEEIYLNDTNNWFVTDVELQKSNGLMWKDATKGEFAFIEDFETLAAKWRLYMRWGAMWRDWRFIGGAQVA